jgi:hypothetical protein
MFAAKGAVKFYSVVHEVGDLEDDSPYAHMHAFVEFATRKNFTGTFCLPSFSFFCL